MLSVRLLLVRSGELGSRGCLLQLSGWKIFSVRLSDRERGSKVWLPRHQECLRLRRRRQKEAGWPGLFFSALPFSSLFCSSYGCCTSFAFYGEYTSAGSLEAGATVFCQAFGSFFLHQLWVAKSFARRAFSFSGVCEISPMNVFFHPNVTFSKDAFCRKAFLRKLKALFAHPWMSRTSYAQCREYISV